MTSLSLRGALSVMTDTNLPDDNNEIPIEQGRRARRPFFV